ncbi:MAG: PAS domain-containing sensor histidine kinase [Firmicutes bacterium]|nr:PAS domain-containing sensor histidine kinase [Bacillota bacterium]
MSLKRLRLAAMFLPVPALILLDLVRQRVRTESLPAWAGYLLWVTAISLLFIVFSALLFRRLELLAQTNVTIRDENKETLAFLQNLIDNSADAIIVVGLDGRVQIWNRGAEAIYGFSREEAIGAIVPMVPADRRHEVQEVIEQVLQDGSVRNYETQRCRRDGQLVNVVVTVSPVRDSNGQIVAFLGISKDITREKQMERQLKHLAVLKERERIGMDLHDSVIQSIYALALQLEDCGNQVESAPVAVRLRLDQAIETLHSVICDIRSYIFNLGPGFRIDGDLIDGLKDLLRSFEVNSLLGGKLHTDGDFSGLEQDRITHLLQLTREALTNVQRHARAATVTITALQDRGLVRLMIQDDGIGFNPGLVMDPHQLGLRNMTTRAVAAGGELRVESTPGHGTTVLVTVPLKSGKTTEAKEAAG